MKSKLLIFIVLLSLSKMSQACDSTQIRLDSTWAGPGPYPGFTIDFNCLDSNLILNFLDPIKTSSIHPQGKNFCILTPSHDTIYPLKAEADTTLLGKDSTKSIQISLRQPLSENGTYYVLVKPDNQNTPIENVCGAQWLSDSITVSVSNCINLSQAEEKLNEKWVVSEKHWAVTVSDKCELTLLDLNGRLVYSQNLEIGFNKISRDSFPSGLYLVFIDKYFTRRLLKP